MLLPQGGGPPEGGGGRPRAEAAHPQAVDPGDRLPLQGGLIRSLLEDTRWLGMVWLGMLDA